MSRIKLARRDFLHVAAGAALMASSRSAAAVDYPTRPVHIVTPYPAGSSPDIVARLIAQWLGERLGQQFVVDNRPGAAGNLGTGIAAKSAPDGYTLLISVSTNAINETLYSNLNFDFKKDFVPVARMATIPFIIVVNPNFPVKTIPELIAYAKANPGKVDMATNGVGTGSHVSAELFLMMAGIKFTHVPYKTNYLTDLMGGQVPLAMSPLAAVTEYIKAGKLRGLGVTTVKRAAALPDVPAIGESVPGYVAVGWYGLHAPKGTPADVIAKLEKATQDSVADPKMQERMAPLGLDPVSLSTADFDKFVGDEIEKWGKVIKFADIKVN